MGLDREPTAWCRYKSGLGDPHELRDELALVCARADVLDDGIAVNDIEGLVFEREGTAVGTDELHACITGRKSAEIVDSDSGHLIRKGIPTKEIVLSWKVVELRDANVEDAFPSARRKGLFV